MAFATARECDCARASLCLIGLPSHTSCPHCCTPDEKSRDLQAAMWSTLLSSTNFLAPDPLANASELCGALVRGWLWFDDPRHSLSAPPEGVARMARAVPGAPTRGLLVSPSLMRQASHEDSDIFSHNEICLQMVSEAVPNADPLCRSLCKQALEVGIHPGRLIDYSSAGREIDYFLNTWLGKGIDYFSTQPSVGK